MKKYRLLFVGFGVVGQGLTEILMEKRGWLQQKYGFDFQIIGAATRSRGSVANPQGLDGKKLLALMNAKKSLNDYPDGKCGLTPIEMIENIPADILIEISYTNIQTAEPATTFCRKALENGLHVVTANKGPIALNYNELKFLADSNRLELGIEGTVMSGTPVLNTALKSLAGCHISKIRGILNSTTNFMLAEMENGKSYAEALKQAQQLGLAEADPTADIEGWDALAKVVILSNVVLGASLKPEEVLRTGITKITSENISRTKQKIKRWKLIGELVVRNSRVDASVQPVELPLSDPLAQVGGRMNGITFDTDLLGPVTVLGSGGGGRSTGFALLTDLLAIHRNAQ